MNQLGALVGVAFCTIAVATGCGSPSAPSVSSTAASPKTGPTTEQQVCNAQSWPRPIPEVVGLVADQAESGALACFDNLKSHTADGDDPLNNGADNSKSYRITAITPPPGAPAKQSDLVTIELVPIDLSSEQPVLKPCDWVSTTDAASILGGGTVTTNPVADEQGSVSPMCSYDSAGTLAVTSNLHLPGSFAVDAVAEFNSYAADSTSHDVSGLVGRAACLTSKGGNGQDISSFYVLLPNNRIYSATGYGAQSCDTLKQFAQAAVTGIGP